MPQLSGDLVRHKLPTYTFGQNVIFTEKTGSTNTELKKLADQGAPEGLLYLTEEQVSGRGRLEKSWQAPPESSLLMSLLFRPSHFLAPRQAQRLTMICALALIEAIYARTDLKPYLKWPNDLVWNDGKKLAGILTELEIEDNKLVWAVVGAGLNVNLDFVNEPAYQTGNGSPPLAQTATSLSMILKRDTSDLRLPILQSFLFNVERRYNALQDGHLPHQAWRERLIGLGEPVVIIGIDGSKRHGTMVGVNEDGALLLAQADGTVETILAGEVSLRR